MGFKFCINAAAVLSMLGLCFILNSPAGAGTWVNASGNLGNMSSECGNLCVIWTVPNQNKTIAGIAGAGLWQSTNGGTSWSRMGGTSGLTITNRPSQIIFDPTNPDIFWECGIYHMPGIVKTTDGGTTFSSLGGIYHNDGIGVDLSDAARLTILAGGHETALKLFKSVNGGQSFVEIGANLPGGTGFSSFPLVYSSQIYVMTTTAGWGGGSAGIFRTINGGTNWTLISSENVSTPPITTSKGQTFFGRGSGGLVKGSADGLTWTVINNGATGFHPVVELPAGKLAALTAGGIAISEDDGATWRTVITGLPINDAQGVAYNAAAGAFYTWRNDCGNVVPADGIWRYDTMMQAGLNIYALSASPSTIVNDVSNTVAITVHATTSSGTISSVTIDLSSIGGASSVAMTKGTGDLYSTSLTIAAGIAAGTKTITATATDNSSNTKTMTASILVNVPAGPLHYKYLYVDTSAIQAGFGWYGNGNGNGTAATGCNTAEVSTGAHEGAKCLDFGYSVAGWWAGFGLAWNNYNYTVNGNGWDTLAFWFKADAGVQLKASFDCPGAPANGATMVLGGTGAWAHAAMPVAFFAEAGYPIDSIIGVGLIVQGTSATTPSPGHVLLDEFYLVGAGGSSVINRNTNPSVAAGSRALTGSGAPTFDLRGRALGALGDSKRNMPNLIVVKDAKGFAKMMVR